MSLPVIVSPEAESQIIAIDGWWRENRPVSPSLFEQELAEALETIAAAPQAGHRYAHSTMKGLRRVPLRATRHHVYYVASKDAVIVLAVWGAIKGAGPDLSGGAR
jgi:plasmid stabilization system protein ParE